MARLKRAEDAFGREMMDYFNGEAIGDEIVERDDGWIETSTEPALYFAEFAQWPDVEKKAIDLARGRVLDVGCGAGRVGRYLQGEGYEVVGIDNSPLAVKVCRERGVGKTRVASLSEFTAPAESFCTVVMFRNNFGLFGDAEHARRLLKRWHRMTTPPARILAASTDPYATRVPEHLQYHRQNRRKGRMGGQIRIRVRYRKHATPWWDLLLVSRDEMRKLVDGTGWKVSDLLDEGGARYVAVLEKEGKGVRR
jgi:SAM-dependent methyltransferase